MTDLVTIWVVPAHVSQATVAMFQDVLDDGERARAAAFQNPHDGRLFTIAHGALRFLAGRALDTQPAAFTWSPGQHGKPELTPPWSGLHTSLSHSGDIIAAAVTASRPVGIDIQHVEPSTDAVALSARFFPPDEASYVAAGHGRRERANRFARLWVRKEAVVKSAGGSLWPNLGIAVRGRDIVTCAKPASSHRVAKITAPGGYRAAVALAGPEPFAPSVTLRPGSLLAPASAGA